MADASEGTFANRDEPIPIVIINPEDDSESTTTNTTAGGTPHRHRDALKRTVSPSRLKEKLEEEKDKRSSSQKLQDRMFSALLQQVLPTEPPSDHPDRRSRKYVQRPGFSLPTMSNNFRRFNARIGIAFVFQNRMIRLFSWRKPTQTMAFLAIYTFVCLDPYLLAVAPLAIALFFIMIPAFLARHPPPPANSGNLVQEKELELYAYPLQGPPLAPAAKIRPAPDLSKDFFRNMRDLQNSMEDFSRMHDAIVATVGPLTNFSDEAVSSAIFLTLSAVACPLFIFAHLLPWRAIFLIGGWAGIVSSHPSVARMLKPKRRRSSKTKDGKPAAGEDTSDPSEDAQDWAHKFIAGDIVLSSSPERREVEIFELQQRVTHTRSFFSATYDPSKVTGEPEYEAYMFTPNPFTPLDPGRVSGARPRGTRFFEDVAPPPGWTWSESKWRLDLGSAEWVGERCVSGVEVEMEGERWVWDIEYLPAGPKSNEELDAADTYEAWVQRGGKMASGESPKSLRVGVGKAKAKEKLPSWEEGNAGRGKKGEWRRRRWVRMVERRVVEDGADGR